MRRAKLLVADLSVAVAIERRKRRRSIFDLLAIEPVIAVGVERVAQPIARRRSTRATAKAARRTLPTRRIGRLGQCQGRHHRRRGGERHRANQPRILFHLSLLEKNERFVNACPAVSLRAGTSRHAIQKLTRADE